MRLLEDVREVFRALKYRKPSKIYCPKCGSARIHPSDSLNYWLTPRKYSCDDCGYGGSIVMELEKEESQRYA